MQAQDLRFQQKMQCCVYKESELTGSGGNGITEERYTYPGIVSQGPSPIAGLGSSDLLLYDDLANQLNIFSLSSRKGNKTLQWRKVESQAFPTRFLYVLSLLLSCDL